MLQIFLSCWFLKVFYYMLACVQLQFKLILAIINDRIVQLQVNKCEADAAPRSNQERGLICACMHVVCIQLAHKPLQEESTQHKPHAHCTESPSPRKNSSTLWSSTAHSQTGIITSHLHTGDKTSLSPYSSIFLCFFSTNHFDFSLFSSLVHLQTSH